MGQLKTTVVFVLLPEFALGAFASARDPLSSANLNLGRIAFDISVVSIDGRPARFSTDQYVGPLSSYSHISGVPEFIFVCGGSQVHLYNDASLMAWLRRMERHGASIGGISTGSWIVAKAGLLDGYRATIHWDRQESFKEVFPLVDLTNALYEVDRNRYTSSGGTASMDMMLYLIAQLHDEETALRSADMHHHGRIRTSDDLQHSSRLLTYRSWSPVLASAAELIESSTCQAITVAELAKRVGVTSRQLERIFMRHLSVSPAKFIMDHRLRLARQLLRQTQSGVSEIAAAAGFSSHSYFCQAYRRQFGRKPSEERAMKAHNMQTTVPTWSVR
ncbi:GlxA family transcriptional regulator [Mesorhizobium sp.]|uniref:GlxA family transcriptional regulator n=1 Tax=Mesorhizobium sp. TaxID=1871066 RepID=UPI0012111611|nr:GlxA family transcriptional regulator [Mesorhizobium sp.]TIN74282.1 MAG: GlxA family transcriptional regulator [Mesorhizobium sp.]TIO63825.1 MAG: GlxA family transcriptional regulator [Mesorhizobium sp.]TJV85621.1 MAG: GlxA family transcriptional regulator [Mesorhizobium sp.]